MEELGVTVGELKLCLHLDVGTLSPMLKRMERAGLITRTRDPQDERRVLIAPTRHGRNLKAAARSVPKALAEKARFDMEQIDDLRDLAQGIVGQLSKAGEIQ